MVYDEDDEDRDREERDLVSRRSRVIDVSDDEDYVENEQADGPEALEDVVMEDVCDVEW